MLNAWLVCALIAVTPFEDVHSRFRLVLPEGWKFTPIPGDSQGAAFQNEGQQIPAGVSVRVYDAEPHMALQAFADAVQQVVVQEPGYRALKEDLAFVAGIPALRRRYVVYLGGDPKRSKMVDALFAIDGKRGYVLHGETLAEAFGSFEKQFASIFDSFEPIKSRSGVLGRDPANAFLAGSFVMTSDRKTTIIFHEDGTVGFEGRQGVYEIDGAQLTLRMVGGEPEVLTWGIHGNILALKAQDWKEPIQYYRKGSAAALVGKWQSGTRKLHLSPTGTIMLESDGGTYSADTGVLIVTLHDGRRLDLRFAVSDQDKLTLSGGRYGAGVTFERVDDFAKKTQP